MGTPTSNVWATIDSVTSKIETALPVIRSASDSLSTIVNGHPTRAAEQKPSSVDELVPRNVGGLNVGQAEGAINTLLIVGGIAVVVIFLSARSRR